MQSIIQADKECFLTGRTDWLEKHHIFGGANRSNSEKYGLWVWLNHYYHNEPPDGVHFNRERRRELQAIGQRAFEERFPDKDFKKMFGRNYVE